MKTTKLIIKKYLKVKDYDKEYGFYESFVTFASIIGLLEILYAISNYRLVGMIFLTQMQCFAFSITFFSLVILKYYNRNIALALLMLSPYISFFGVAYMTGGVESPAVFWLGVIPLGFGILAGVNFSIAAFILSIFFVFVLKFGGGGYDPFVSTKIPRDVVQLRTFIGVSLSTTVSIIYVINKNNRDLVEINNRKEQMRNLLRLFSHDVANPLFIIIGNIQKFKKNNPSFTVNKEIDAIDRSSNVIKEIVENLRYLEFIENKKISRKSVLLNLGSVINESLNNLKEQIANKKIVVEVANVCNEISFVNDQAMIVNNILNPIISNAIKYSYHDGKIKIESKRINNELEIIIEDYGTGIKAEIIKQIFNPNKESVELGTDNEKGHGLGLLIAKSYIEVLDGQISIDSQFGQGTKVLISLPIDQWA